MVLLTGPGQHRVNRAANQEIFDNRTGLSLILTATKKFNNLFPRLRHWGRFTFNI